MAISDLESWMWAEACDMIARADRLHRQFFKPAVIQVNHPFWEPPVDVYETAGEFKIIIALPGVAVEHLQVQLDGNRLLVAGQRPFPMAGEVKIHRLEIPYGRFERSLEIPENGVKSLTHEFTHGCLLITLTKA